jgi:AP-3 complex subunit mu
VTLYQLLDEMLDSGVPVNTHPGGLKALVPPPSLVNRVSSQVFGHQGVLVSDQDPSKALPLPWRSNGIKYASNEIYLDVIESIDATLDAEGRVLTSEVHGVVEVNCRLSGMPDVSLGLSNSHLIEEYNFHPSVRLSRFAADRVVSFVPADGTFTLMTYKVRAPSNAKHDSAWRPKYIKPNAWAASQPGHSGGALASVSDPRAAQLPLYIRPQATFGATQGRVSIVCGTKPSAEKPVEAVRLEVRLPARTSFADPTSTHGVATYDDASHSVLWSIETFPKDKTPCLTVALNMEESEGGGGGGGGGGSSSEKTARARTVSLQEIVDVQATFAVKGVGVSGIKVESVQVRNEKYTPSQGVRYHTRGGRVVVRT